MPFKFVVKKLLPDDLTVITEKTFVVRRGFTPINQSLARVLTQGKNTGDNDIIFDDAHLAIFENANGDKIGIVGAGEFFGLVMTAIDDDGNSEALLIFGSAVVLGSETLGITLNGAQAGDTLRLGDPYDIAGEQVFPVLPTPSQPPEQTQTETDANDFTLTGTFQEILSMDSNFNFLADLSVVDFTMRLEEQANRSTVVEYTAVLNADNPNTGLIFQFTIPKNNGVTRITLASGGGLQSDILDTDTVRVFARAVDTGSGRVTRVVGSDIPTKLTLSQLAITSNAIQRLKTHSTNTVLSESTFNRLLAGTEYTFPTASNFDPAVNDVIDIKNFTLDDILLTADGSDTIDGQSSVLVCAREYRRFIKVSPTTWEVGAAFEPRFKVRDSSPVASLNTVDSYVDKLSITGTFAAGEYVIDLSYFWNMSVGNRSFEAIIEIDTVEQIFISREKNEPTDTPFENIRIIRTLSSGPHTIKFRFRPEDSGRTATVSEAHMEIQRS